MIIADDSKEAVVREKKQISKLILRFIYNSHHFDDKIDFRAVVQMLKLLFSVLMPQAKLMIEITTEYLMIIMMN